MLRFFTRKKPERSAECCEADEIHSDTLKALEENKRASKLARASLSKLHRAPMFLINGNFKLIEKKG